MKKTLGLKAGILGVAILAAGAFATVPAILPQTAYAAEKSNSSSATDKMYTIARKINLIFQENGKTTDIKTLVQKGYVLREPSKRDRRCVVLNLTDEGMARFNTIEKDMNLKFERVFSMIPKEKQSQVLEALNIYNDAIKKSEVKCCD